MSGLLCDCGKNPATHALLKTARFLLYHAMSDIHAHAFPGFARSKASEKGSTFSFSIARLFLGLCVGGRG